MIRLHSPPPRLRQRRRGVALLVVLAALILVTTTSVALARLTSTEAARRSFAAATRLADDLLIAVEEPILHWLAEESSTVVLPPDALGPRVAVLYDSWSDAEHGTVVVRVTAWDQFGMVSMDAARAGSPLRLNLPDAARRALDRVKHAENSPPGLDQFLAREAHDSGGTVFPMSGPSDVLWFGQGDAEVAAVDNDARQDTPLALGSIIATHNGDNPATWRRTGRRLRGSRSLPSGGVVNVNTAPIELIESAMRAAGRGGIEVVIDARTRGESVPLGSLTNGRSQQQQANTPVLVGSSSAWAFRIDISVGPLTRSWWAVYSSSRSQWECVQRLAITE